MMRNELVGHLDRYLRLAEILDYGPQGYQMREKFGVEFVFVDQPTDP